MLKPKKPPVKKPLMPTKIKGAVAPSKPFIMPPVKKPISPPVHKIKKKGK